ncbi:MAG: hypothetical protein ACREEP_01105 [Dongiaceae bacterium]
MKEKGFCAKLAKDIQDYVVEAQERLAACLASGDCDAQETTSDVESILELPHEVNAYRKCAADPPDPLYKQLAAAASDTPADYINAFTRSMERYKASRSYNDPEWMARHATAMRLYLKRYADAARRRSSALRKKAEAFRAEGGEVLAKRQAARDRVIEGLRRGEALAPQVLKRARDAGLSEEDTKAMYQRLSGMTTLPPVKGVRDRLLESAAQHEQSADEAEKLSAGAADAGPPPRQARTFELANPHDRNASIDLYVHRAQIPPDWKLSLVNAAPEADKADLRLQEIDAGRHYRIGLPAKGQVTLASRVEPAGALAENTSARFAVEGWIGGELIGGIVHEMHVPGMLADLQLPPVGSAETDSAAAPQQPAGGLRWQMWLVIAGGVSLLALILFVWVQRRRRKA